MALTLRDFVAIFSVFIGATDALRRLSTSYAQQVYFCRYYQSRFFRLLDLDIRVASGLQVCDAHDT